MLMLFTDRSAEHAANCKRGLVAIGLLTVALLVSGCGSLGGTSARPGSTPAGSTESAARSSSEGSSIAFAQLPTTRPEVNVKPRSAQLCSDYVRAETLLLEITRIQPELSGPWLNLGQVYLAGERTDSARRAFERAIEANPTNCAAFNQLGVLARREGRLDEAESSYLACIDRDPTFPQVYLNLGILYEVYLGKLPQALKAYREYQELQVSAGVEDDIVKGWVIDLERRL